LCGIIGSLPIVWMFDHLGRFDLARPALCSIGMIGIVIAIKWKQRREMWFWTTVAAIVALHVLLILFVPWTTKWVPAVVIIPIGIADLYAMLAVLSVVGKFVERPKPSER
jgi:hypothetical protein